MTESDPSPPTEGSTAIATHKETIGTELSGGLDPVVDPLPRPLAFGRASDGEVRFIPGNSGHIYIREDGSRSDELRFDLSEKATEVESRERGSVGFTVHPSVGTSRRTVRYSDPLRDGVPDDSDRAFVPREFAAPMDFSRIEPSSERTGLVIPEPGPAHSGGTLEFGPEKCIHIGVGGRLTHPVAGYPNHKTRNQTRPAIHRWMHSPEFAS